MDREKESETVFEAYKRSLALQLLQHQILLQAWEDRDMLREELRLVKLDLEAKRQLIEKLGGECVPLGWTPAEILAREG